LAAEPDWADMRRSGPMNLRDFQAVHDITALLDVSPCYPGDRPYQKQMVSLLDAGEDCELSELAFSAHAGTHIDSPAHFFSLGKTIDQYPPQRFILPAQVLSVDDADSIKPSALQDLNLDPGAALLFKTQNSRRGLLKRKQFSEDYVFLAEDAAKCCVGMGVSLIGIDYLSVDRFGDDLFPAHRILLENDILILESITLEEISPGSYMLLCLPLKLRGEAAPARAVLLR